MSAINTVSAVPASRAGVRISWRAVFAGIVVALGVWLLLTVLGLAIGLSSIDPNQPSSAKPAGIVTGIWSLVVPLIALFVGGVVTATSAVIVDRLSGVLHGAVMWSAVTLASVLLIGSVVRAIGGMAFEATSAVATGAGSIAAAGARGGPDVASALGIDTSDLVAPINQRLRDEGKPTITATQLNAAARDAAQRAVREGRVDRDVLATSIAQNTRLSRADVDDLANRVADRIDAKRSEVTQDIRTGALQAADTTGKALWWVFFGMLFGLGSSILGATIGVKQRQRRIVPEPIVYPTTREAHP